MDINTTFSEYREKAPSKSEIHYWDLHPQLCVGFSSIPEKIKMKGKSITIGRLCSLVGKNSMLEKIISFMVTQKRLRRRLNIRFPFSIDNLYFVELYALMISEGSFKTEFRLHVPENIFHNIFEKSLTGLFGDEIKDQIKQKPEKNIMRTSAPCSIRYFLPITKHIPKFILVNKEKCRRYLQIAFEAEGSPILIKSKRYISLKRNVDITHILENKTHYIETKRIYTGQLEKDYPSLKNLVEDKPPLLLLGEKLILKHYFNIASIMKLEAIRINKTNYRCGKISARWALYIYADSVNRFIKEINFLTKRKKDITAKMLKIKGRNRQYFSLDVMKSIEKDGKINTSDFVKKMKSKGYKSPMTYLWRYSKKGLIKRTKRGEYELLIK
ncbi:MAG: hypothetical protein ISS36_03950 [Candidatus Aenigmarchaeota archaeon]|nr:hypothetical protein [Candidatus Aenigmarchaeota archaeon]